VCVCVCVSVTGEQLILGLSFFMNNGWDWDYGPRVGGTGPAGAFKGQLWDVLNRTECIVGHLLLMHELQGGDTVPLRNMEDIK